MMMPLNDPLPMPAPGTIVDLPASAIYHSNDPLRLRVKEVGQGEPIHPAAEWVTISGDALNDDDSVRGYRSALVCVKALADLTGAPPVLISHACNGETGWHLHGLTEAQLSGGACLNCGGQLTDLDTNHWHIGWHGETQVFVHLECVDMYRAKAIAHP